MVDEVITKQELIDAQKDAQSLDDFINGGDEQIVVTRLLKEYPTLANAIRQIYEKGGKFYPTLAEANADIANIRTDVYVITGDDGAYHKATAGATTLTKSPYDPVELGKKSFLNTFDTFAQLEVSSLDRYAFAAVVNDLDQTKNGYYQKIADYSWSRVRFNSETEIRNFLSKKGFAIIVPLQPTSINYSSTDKTLTFTGTVYALTERNTYTINTPVTLNLPENQAYRVEFNETSKDIRCVHGGSNREDGWLIAATIHKTLSGIYTSDFSGFNVDGAQQPTVADVLKIDAYKADLQAPAMSINLDELTITLPSNAQAYTARGRLAVAAQSITYTGSTGRKNVVLNKDDLTLSAVNDSTLTTLLSARTHYLLFTLNATTGELYGYTSQVTVTGGSFGSVYPNSITVLSTPESLNFDFANDKIVISSNLWAYYQGDRFQITPREIELDPARNRQTSTRYLLFVNPSTGDVQLRNTAAGFTIPKSYLQFAAWRERDLLFTDIQHFSVNGEPFNSSKEKVKPVFGWSANNKVDVNVADTFLPLDTTNLSNLTSSTVYGWFDALVAAHPDYITKTLLGNDASGTLPVYQYRFNPKRSGTDGRLDTKIPKVMLMTQHNEGINFVYSYLLMREICNNWQNNEALESMRFGIEFVVVPVGNPWGLDNGNRKNSNSVDLNRNFPIGWMKLGTPSDTFYSGESALSEAEVQHIYNVMTTEKPDIFFDCHSYGSWNNNGRSVWLPVLNEKSRITAMSTAEKVYAQYKKKFDWLVDLDDLIYISDSTVTGGGIASKSAESVGAVGGTIEIAWNLKDEPSGLTGHNSIVNFATDYLGTSVLQALSVIISSK